MKISKIKLSRKTLSILIVVAAIIVLIGSYVALRGREQIKIKNSSYCVVNGNVIDLGSSVKLIHKDEVTTVKVKDRKYTLQSYPILVEEEGTIIVQKSGSLNRTDTDTLYRVDYFSKFIKSENGYIVQRGSKKSDKLTGVFYDNENTYIFFERAVLTWGNNERIIEPGEIVECSYMDHMIIYGLNKDVEYYAISDVNTVMAKFDGGKRVNLATDRFYQLDGTWRLLYMPLDYLKDWQ